MVNAEEMEALRTEIKSLRSGGMSWKALSDDSGIPAGTFSPWLDHKYNGDNEAVALRVRQYLQKRADRSQIRGLPERSAEAARRTAVLGRVGQLDDIANQVVTFCTSTSVTGQTLVIDGGMPGAMR